MKIWFQTDDQPWEQQDDPLAAEGGIRMAKGRKKHFARFLGFALFFGLLLYVGSVLLEQQREMMYLQRMKAENQRAIEALEGQLSEIQENIDSANSDEFVEKIARQQLKMIGPEETLFIDLGKRGE